MAATYFGIGSGVNSATAPSAEYPASLVAGMGLLLVIVNKYPTNATSLPSGWSQPSVFRIQGGTGSPGSGAGDVYITCYTKISDGTESGSVSMTITGGNSAVARMIAVQPATPGNLLDFEIGSGAFNTGSSTAWSITTSENIDTEVDDLMIALNGINTAAYIFSTGYNFTQTGVTFGTKTQRTSSSTTGGDDCRLQITTCSVTAGSADAPITYAMTAAGSDAGGPAGATLVVRVREIPGGAMAGTGSGVATVSSTIKGYGRGVASGDGVATISGTIKGYGRGAASSSGVAAPTGTIKGNTNLSGSSAGVASPSGSMIAFMRAVGTVTGLATVSSTIKGYAHAIANSDGIATVSSTIRGFAYGAASVTGLATVAAILGGYAYMGGTSAGVGSGTSTIRGTGNASGAADGSATPTGILRIILQISGDVTGLSTLLGIIRGNTSLSGTTDGVADGVGVLTAADTNIANYKVKTKIQTEVEAKSVVQTTLKTRTKMILQ